ncbi:unnamed protein product [Ascophyllum nodosum]
MFQGQGESVVDIRLKRKDRTYRPNDVLEGTLVVSTPEAWDCKAINLSYSGVYLSIGYHISVKIERGLMRKELSKKVEFIVEVPGQAPTPPMEVPFEITHETLEYAPKRYGRLRRLRPFRVTGKLHEAAVSTSRPLTGEVVVETSECPLKSLEVQLVRVETVEQAEGQLREATEIQNLQIGDGDVCRGLAIPIYMVLPRLFSCPTMITPRFRVEFELNIIVCFADSEGYTATQNFQILLV